MTLQEVALIIRLIMCYAFFRYLDSATKMRLLIPYCYSLYGCTNSNITHPCIESVCSAWRAGIRRVLGLYT